MKQSYPWYSDTRSGGGWFVKIRGEQAFLGKHPAGATTASPPTNDEIKRLLAVAPNYGIQILVPGH